MTEQYTYISILIFQTIALTTCQFKQASSEEELERLEHHWIHTLQTQVPKGLNVLK